MANQTTYGFMAAGYPGQRVGMGHIARTYTNDAGNIAQVDDITPAVLTRVAQVETVTPAGTADGTYTITLNGIARNFAAVGQTLAQIVNGLVAAINAAGLGLTAVNTANTVVITANVAGTPFTIATSSTGSVLNVAHTTANVGTGDTYSFTVNSVSIAYVVRAGDTTLQIRDGLIQSLRDNALMQEVVYANPNGNNVRLTAAFPGTAFTAAAGTSTSRSAVTANAAPSFIGFGLAVIKRTGAGTDDRSAGVPTAGGQTLLGVAERIHSIVDPLQGGVTGLGPNAQAAAPGQDMTVGRRGTWLVSVEVAVAPEDAAFFRTTANGALTTIGAWRNTNDGGNADAVPNGGGRFKTSAVAGGIAELEINLP